MVFPVAHLAAQSNPSSNTPSLALPACSTRFRVRLRPSFYVLSADEMTTAVVALLHAGKNSSDFSASGFLPVRRPSSPRDHASGLYPTVPLQRCAEKIQGVAAIARPLL
jgi:hypothetical protein